ncbi:retrovirus-related pol polyprotein from transposon TNT 1-94, partial [Tanacetum coccineum]
MLADSLLPIPFWAEAVNTACYVLNRVLVTKPQNKTPYELLIGKQPSISFIRPFGCPLTILNTLDPLGKFDGKSEDEETEDQGRKIQDIDDDPLVSLVRNSMEEKEADFVTPKKVSASGETQEEDISPTTLEAAKTLSKVASQNVSTYKRRARSASKGKDIGIGMDFFSA